ncbi:MAG: DUF177 domain-containing protein [Alphaproteobacteria bacterium]
MTDEPEFSRPVVVESLRGGPSVMDIEATAEERAALARRFGLLTLDHLSATVEVTPVRGGTLVEVTGRLTAELAQSCVVTLEPVPSRIDERFAVSFGEGDDDVMVDFSLDDGDPPEPIVDGTIDIGEAVAQHLAVAIDPFPRRPGATLTLGEDGDGGHDGDQDGDREGPASPFAVLAGLRLAEKKGAG